MQTYILWLLGISILLQALILAHFYRKKRRMGSFSVDNKHQATSVVKLLNAYNKVIAIKWYVDMMMDGDFGSLNIAQIQFLHQMSVDAEVALQDLKDISNFKASALPDQVKHMSRGSEKLS